MKEQNCKPHHYSTGSRVLAGILTTQLLIAAYNRDRSSFASMTSEGIIEIMNKLQLRMIKAAYLSTVKRLDRQLCMYTCGRVTYDETGSSDR